MTVFEISDQDISIYYPAFFGLIFIFAGYLLTFHTQLTEDLLPRGLRGEGRRISGVFFMVFALLWTGWVVGGGYVQRRGFLDALHSGRAKVVEGVVTNFEPMPAGCHGQESFDVGSSHFSYADCIANGGFNQSSTFGGPIHGGEHVRITDLDGTILKLEVLNR